MKAKINTAYNLFLKLKRPFGSIQFLSTLGLYWRFVKDLKKYVRQSQEKIKIADLTPMLWDKTSSQPFDSHYFYQGIWAFNKIKNYAPTVHVDVGGQIDLVGFLTTVTFVEYVDIRVLGIGLPNFLCKKGNILEMPYENESVKSISCLHVAEHIGLGRYGDDLNPLGTLQACKELGRVLAPSGNLLFSLPIGKEKVCFNAHRIHDPQTILDYFSDLTLVEFSAVNDQGEFVSNVNIRDLENSQYSTGLFHFTKQA